MGRVIEKGIITAIIVLTVTLVAVVASSVKYKYDSPKEITLIPPAEAAQPPRKLTTIKADILTLHVANTVNFRGVVTEESVAKLQEKIFKLSAQLSPNEPIYLTLNTPGGEIMAGTSLIESLKAVKQPVKTVTLFAASMGFQIAQHLDERIVAPNGILMSHRAHVGLEGQVPGEFDTRLNFFKRIMERLDLEDATRMGLTVEKYKDLIHDEYWVSGADAVQDKAADKVAYIRCSSDLLGTETVAMQTMFGPVTVTYSQCPVITAPLAIDMSAMHFKTNAERQEWLAYQDLLFNNRQAFVNKYITTGEYKKIQPK